MKYLLALLHEHLNSQWIFAKLGNFLQWLHLHHERSLTGSGRGCLKIIRVKDICAMWNMKHILVWTDLHIYMYFVFPIFILDTLLFLASVFLCQSLLFSLCQGIGLLTLWEPNSGNKKHWGYWFNWLTPDNHQIKIFTIVTPKNIPPCNKDQANRNGD